MTSFGPSILASAFNAAAGDAALGGAALDPQLAQEQSFMRNVLGGRGRMVH